MKSGSKDSGLDQDKKQVPNREMPTQASVEELVTQGPNKAVPTEPRAATRHPMQWF